MACHHDLFLVYDKYDGGLVYLGDDSPLDIVGHGILKGINGVFHILGFVQNLLLASKIHHASVQVVLFDNGCKMIHGAIVFAKGVCVVCLFHIDACTIWWNNSLIS